MTPGLARGPPFPSGATKNSIVAIASLERPSVPRVIGVCEIDVSSLQQVQGAKGHAVRGYHWDGDEIWGWGQSGKPGSDAPNLIEGWDPADELDSLSSGLEVVSMAGQDSQLKEDGDSQPKKNHGVSIESTYNEYVDGVDATLNQETHVKEKELSQKGQTSNMTSSWVALI